MADLEKSLTYIKSSDMDYYGISRKFFPKWAGWEALDEGVEPSLEVLKDFYKEFFWDKLMLDLVESQDCADLIFLFSSKCGKKKVIQKLNRIFGIDITEGNMTVELVMCLNKSCHKTTFLFLYAELVEFLWMMDKKSTFIEVLKVYNKFCQSM